VPCAQVPCQTDSQCYSSCGEHPDSGIAYVCTKDPVFYTYHVINRSLTKEDLALAVEAESTSLPAATDYDSQAYKLAVLEARPKWITNHDSFTTKSYFIDEPGDDQFDTQPGEGVCSDINYAYQHSNCDSRVGSAIIEGLVGCTAKLGVNLAFCGATIDRTGPDFLSTSISASSLDWEEVDGSKYRTLSTTTDVNGEVTAELKCYDAWDCATKCERLARTSRNGRDIPPGCALCDSVCPSNAGTTLFDTIEALSIDIGNAVRVVGKCLAGGFTGCTCNILLAMKPVWIDQLPSPQERCSGGNVFGLLVSKILEMYAADDQNTSHPFDSRWQHLFTFLWYNLSCLDFALPPILPPMSVGSCNHKRT
jgi:hypothetical protein